MKLALRNFLLFVFALLTLNSCLVRPSPYKNWSTRRHPKFFYKKGNNYGGRKFWVRDRHYSRSIINN